MSRIAYKDFLPDEGEYLLVPINSGREGRMRSVEIVEIGVERAKAFLSLHHFGSQSSPSLLFVAGQHGRELTSIFVATRLIEMLKDTGLRTGHICVIPVVNLPGVAAGTRDNPVDGTNINRCYNDQPKSTFSEIIASEVLKIAGNYDVVIDLHSADRARYLSHVIIHREEDAELARVFGLNFVIMRNNSQNEGGTGLTLYLADHGRQAMTLELGAGEVVRDSDVVGGLGAIERFLVHLGMSSLKEDFRYFSKPQQLKNRLYLYDAREIIKAGYDMLVCWQTLLGNNVCKGELLGRSIRVENPDESAAIIAPISGKIIYLRDRSLVQKGETLFMLIPDTQGGDVRG